MPTDLEGLWEKLEEASAPEMGGLDAWFPPACEPIITQWVTEHDAELMAENERLRGLLDFCERLLDPTRDGGAYFLNANGRRKLREILSDG